MERVLLVIPWVAVPAGGEESVIVRSGVMVGSSAWVVSGRWVWLVVWCSVCVAGAGYFRCACWRGCVDRGGLSACPRVELLPALSCCLCVWVAAVLCVAVALGVDALGAWWTWYGVGARVDVYLMRAAGGLSAAAVLLPCVWRFVLSGGVWLVCAPCGLCGAWQAWVVPVWVFRIGGWMCVRRLRNVVGRDGRFSGVRGRLVADVASGVVSGGRFGPGRCGLGHCGGFDWTAWWLWCRWAA